MVITHSASFCILTGAAGHDAELLSPGFKCFSSYEEGKVKKKAQAAWVHYIQLALTTHFFPFSPLNFSPCM